MNRRPRIHSTLSPWRPVRARRATHVDAPMVYTAPQRGRVVAMVVAVIILAAVDAALLVSGLQALAVAP